MKRRLQNRKVGTILTEPNTFIGGVGATSITSAADFASWTNNLVESDITNFSIDVNNNVSFNLYVSPVFVSPSFSDCTYYVNKNEDLLYNSIQGFLQQSSSCKVYYNAGTDGSHIYLQRNGSGISTLFLRAGFSKIIGQRQFQQMAGLKYVWLDGYETLKDIANFNGTSSIERIWLGNITLIGASNTTNTNEFLSIKLNAKIYVIPSMLTINGGSLEPDLSYAETTRSATIIPIYDYTPPSSVTDLSASSITSSGCNLDFTAPSSTNTLDFYEVWVENIDLDEWHVDRVAGRYSINQEITASGDTITGLSSGTNYKVWIVACDEYWNRSEISNEITFTTL